MQRALIIIGLAIVLVGVAWPLISKLGLGRLPGDILIKRENFTFYFPLSTMVIVSIVLTIVLRFLNK